MGTGLGPPTATASSPAGGRSGEERRGRTEGHTRSGRSRGSLKRARARAPPDSGFPAPLPALARCHRRLQRNLSSLRGATESSRPRRQLVDMETPTWPRVPSPEAAVARMLLLIWVLLQVARTSGEWHPLPKPSGARPEEGARPAARRCPAPP